MPKITHWLSPPALVSFALTAISSACVASQPELPGWLLWVATLTPLLIWFLAARQAGVAAEARDLAARQARIAAEARDLAAHQARAAAEVRDLAAETLASMKRLAELTGVIANQPPQVLAQAIADQDAENRNAIINQLTQVYVLMYRDVSQDVIEGSEPPPSEWLNERLEKLGLNWRVRIMNDGELESYTP